MSAEAIVIIGNNTVAFILEDKSNSYVHNPIFTLSFCLIISHMKIRRKTSPETFSIFISSFRKIIPKKHGISTEYDATKEDNAIDPVLSAIYPNNVLKNKDSAYISVNNTVP